MSLSMGQRDGVLRDFLPETRALCCQILTSLYSNYKQTICTTTKTTQEPIANSVLRATKRSSVLQVRCHENKKSTQEQRDKQGQQDNELTLMKDYYRVGKQMMVKRSGRVVSPSAGVLLDGYPHAHNIIFSSYIF